MIRYTEENEITELELKEISEIGNWKFEEVKKDDIMLFEDKEDILNYVYVDIDYQEFYAIINRGIETDKSVLEVICDIYDIKKLSDEKFYKFR